MLASLEKVLTLLELTAPQLAAQDRAALPIYPVGEVLTGDADLLTFPVLELSNVEKIPVVHRQNANSAKVLIHA